MSLADLEAELDEAILAEGRLRAQWKLQAKKVQSLITEIAKKRKAQALAASGGDATGAGKATPAASQASGKGKAEGVRGESSSSSSSESDAPLVKVPVVSAPLAEAPQATAAPARKGKASKLPRPSLPVCWACWRRKHRVAGGPAHTYGADCLRGTPGPEVTNVLVSVVKGGGDSD